MLEAVDGHCHRRRTRRRVSAVEYPGEPHSRRSPRQARPARPPPSGGFKYHRNDVCRLYQGLKMSSHRPTAICCQDGHHGEEFAAVYVLDVELYHNLVHVKCYGISLFAALHKADI